MKPYNEYSKEGFSLPEGYFDQSAKQMQDRVQEEGFELPDRYFDSLKSLLDKKEAKVISLTSNYFRWASVAAVFMVAVGSWFLMDQGEEVELFDNQEVAFLDYLMDDPSLINEEDLDFYFEELTEEIGDEALLDYLDDEDLDWETLEEII